MHTVQVDINGVRVFQITRKHKGLVLDTALEIYDRPGFYFRTGRDAFENWLEPLPGETTWQGKSAEKVSTIW